MQNATLISGLIGALIAAALSFGVRLLLDKRAQRDAERRIAYVYLVRVSEFVAVDIVMRYFIKMYLRPDAAKELTGPDGTFEPSHRVSAILAEGLARLSPEEIEKEPAIHGIPKFANTLLEAAKESRLSPEQLSKLPREVVFAYHQFQNYYRGACQVVDMWSGFFEKNERFWVTPEEIHGQWRALVSFSNQARVLRSALIRYGASTSEQASSLLLAQVLATTIDVGSMFLDKPKLLAATAAAKEAAKNEPAV